MNSIRDILKESVEQAGLIQSISPARILVSMLVAIICSAIIYAIYKMFYRGAVYSQNFNILLVIVCLVTSFIIMTISSNLVLSLGMVGALSIVRFRAAVKDPLDVGFLFWAIATGITTGAGLYPVALIGTVIIGLAYVGLTLLNKGKNTFLLVVKYDDSAAVKVDELMKTVKFTLKSKTKRQDENELTVQIKLVNKDTGILDSLLATKGVKNAILVEYTGDYA